MVDDIAEVLEALQSESARRPIHPASAIRRRGDRRRTTVRVAASAGTVAIVGATAGTAYAVAQLPSAGHGGSVGFATTPSHHATNKGQSTGDASAEPSPVPSPTPTATPPTPVPTPTGGSTQAASPLPSPTLGRGTAQPTASPNPTSP